MANNIGTREQALIKDDFEIFIDTVLQNAWEFGADFQLSMPEMDLNYLSSAELQIHNDHYLIGRCGSAWNVLVALYQKNRRLANKMISVIKKTRLMQLEKLIVCMRKEIDNLHIRSNAILANKPFLRINSSRRKDYDETLGELEYCQKRLPELLELLKFHQSR